MVSGTSDATSTIIRLCTELKATKNLAQIDRHVASKRPFLMATVTVKCILQYIKVSYHMAYSTFGGKIAEIRILESQSSWDYLKHSLQQRIFGKLAPAASRHLPPKNRSVTLARN